MPTSSPDLHGSAPDTSPVALLLVDIINDFNFEDGEQLLKQTRPAAQRIRALKEHAREAGVPVIYANDNFGRWQSSFEDVVARCTADDARGSDIASQLKPEEDDYFILKPKQSAFYQTTLTTLLEHLGVHTLVLAGVTADICVLFSAVDAYVRGMHLVIPRDAVASVEPSHTDDALTYARRVLKAKTPPSEDFDFDKVLRDAKEGPSAQEREQKRQQASAA